MTLIAEGMIRGIAALQSARAVAPTRPYGDTGGILIVIVKSTIIERFLKIVRFCNHKHAASDTVGEIRSSWSARCVSHVLYLCVYHERNSGNWISQKVPLRTKTLVSLFKIVLQ